MISLSFHLVSTPATDPRLILLSPQDNLVVAASTLPKGESLRLDGAAITLTAEIGVGHKIARRPIQSGGKVFKYGVAIGSATCDIALGDHIHTHNLKSDYLPTYAREGKGSYANHH